MAAEPAPPRGRRPTRERVLRMLPTAIATLWIAGIAQFRSFDFGPLDYAVLLAAAIALQLVLDRARPRRPPIALPERSNPAMIALLAAMISGSLALVLGGLAEAAIPAPPGKDLPAWSLRTLWHGACAFGASYCRFLERLTGSRR